MTKAMMRLSAPQLEQTSGRDSNSRDLFPSRRHGPEIARRRSLVAQPNRGRWARLGADVWVVIRIAPECDGRCTQGRVGREHAVGAMAVAPARRPICEQAAPRDGRSAPVDAFFLRQFSQRSVVRRQHLGQHRLFAFFRVSRHGSLAFAPCHSYSSTVSDGGGDK